MRTASVLVADEVMYNLLGKLTIHGVYTSDIAIPTDQAVLSQLVFLFLMETDLQQPFRSITLEVKLPGGQTVQNVVPVSPLPPSLPPGRTRHFIKWPVLVQSPIVRPGRIEAKVIHESGEIHVTTPWIVLVPPAAAAS